MGGVAHNDEIRGGGVTAIDSIIVDNGGVGIVSSSNALAHVIRSTVARNAGWGVEMLSAGEVTNSTISGNRGGILIKGDNFGGLHATINNSTIVENGDLGGLVRAPLSFPDEDQPSVVLNSVIARNAGGDCVGIASDVGLISGGHNLIGDATRCPDVHPTDRVGTESAPLDPLLEQLAYHGGFGPVHRPALASPAVDGASTEMPGSSSGACATTDQRGVARPQRGSTGILRCDIGAFELAKECADGIDDDRDGLVDLADFGCKHPDDVSERASAYACDDGKDNDGDGLVDFAFDGSGDVGCLAPKSAKENPACQDGKNNDRAFGTDFDSGVSVLGAGRGDPNGADPQCTGSPWRDREF